MFGVCSHDFQTLTLTSCCNHNYEASSVEVDAKEQNRQNVGRPRQGVVISVPVGSVGQPCLTGAPLGISKNILLSGVAFKLPISSTCENS